MELNLRYERGTARKASQETKFWSSVNPNFYQIFKIEQGLDIMRNATVPVRDRVAEFSYKATGGKIVPSTAPSAWSASTRCTGIIGGSICRRLRWWSRGESNP